MLILEPYRLTQPHWPSLSVHQQVQPELGKSKFRKSRAVTQTGIFEGIKVLQISVSGELAQW